MDAIIPARDMAVKIKARLIRDTIANRIEREKRREWNELREVGTHIYMVQWVVCVRRTPEMPYFLLLLILSLLFHICYVYLYIHTLWVNRISIWVIYTIYGLYPWVIHMYEPYYPIYSWGMG